jgi:Uma2 family endonuclease
MGTVLKLGPADHGRPMTLDEVMAGDYAEGYQYELIDGKLYVSPEANLPQGFVEYWILMKVYNYTQKHPEVINFVYNKARVFVPGRRGVTNPEPDLAAYRDFPEDRPLGELSWENFSPVLVAEVLSAEDPDKDLVRNAGLYFQVPSIKEYWLFDSRENADRPTLRVHRRYGKRWRIIDVAPGETYTTRLLPGFKLLLDPHR